MDLVPALLYVDSTSLVLLTIIVMIMVEGEQTPFPITSGVVKRFSFTSWECAHFAAGFQVCANVLHCYILVGQCSYTQFIGPSCIKGWLIRPDGS